MSFIRVEVRMPTGPKFDRIPSAAGWLHVAALCYAGHNLTDGFVPAGQIYKLTNDRHDVVDRAVAWLTSVRPGCEEPLWHAVRDSTGAGTGWYLHDYDDPEYGNPTRAVVESLRDAAAKGGKRSAEVRRKKYGSAQPPTQTPEAPPNPLVRTASAEALSNPLVRTASEAHPVPPRTTPPLRASHAAPATATAPPREPDPDDEPIEVLARMDLLVEAFDGHDGLLRRQLRGEERPVLMNWAHLERDGLLVPLDEIVQLARRLLATPFRDGLTPATLRAIEPTVQTLARGPAGNATANGVAQDREMDEMVARMEARRAREGKA